jgi:hypothetical protein
VAALGRIKSGDVVEVDVNGRIFCAMAGTKDGRELRIEPLPGQMRTTYTRVTARQIRRHWRLTKNTS